MSNPADEKPGSHSGPDSTPELDDAPTLAAGATGRRSAMRIQPGTTSGNYRLLQAIGHGGMGEVWEAEQTEPIRRRVAIKIVKRGMDSRAVLNRFEAERQALAVMDHPSIAKVYDAGTLPDGRPFFAMELVRGDPITDYCDRNRLTLGERLELFQKLCAAVQHAHQKAIIHRDLKPSNVLVSERDGKAHPTVIDFGVAKALAQSLSEGTLYTQVGQMIGTPEYMSPEQAEMTALGIDTRTDVYSLGVILYELLAGVLPFDRDELRAAGFGGIQRILREQEPRRPSTRVSTVESEDSDRLARARRSKISTLVRELRGDLDWIVLKAMEKDRTRRYQAPSDLADDLRRHLAHQPIEARPQSTAYRISRFVRRHRLGVGLAAAFVTLLLFSTIALLLQAQRITRERDRANEEAETALQVSRFLTELFEVSDPDQARGETITAREILDRGAQRIEAELADQPVVQARLMASIGTVYLTLGLFDDADRLLRTAAERQEQLLGEENPETLATWMRWTDVLFRQGRYEELLPVSEKLLEQRTRLLGADHPETLEAAAGHAALLTDLGRLDEARVLYEDLLEQARREFGEGSAEVAEALYSIAILHLYEDRFDEAVTTFQEVVDGLTRHQGPKGRMTLTAKSMLGTAHQALGELDRAEALHREVLAGRRVLLGESHDGTLMALGHLGSVLTKRGEYEEAEQLLTDLVALRREHSAPNNPWTASALHSYGALLLETGRFAEAENVVREALEIDQGLFDPWHRDLVEISLSLSRALEGLGRSDEAERVVAKLLEELEAAAGKPTVATSLERVRERRAELGAGGL